MNLLDREVFIVLLVLMMVVSVIGLSYIVRSNIYIVYNQAGDSVKLTGIKVIDENPSFESIGLLNQHCMMGPYDKVFFNGERLNYCFMVYNGYNEPRLYQIRYKLSLGPIPSRKEPLDTTTISNYTILVNPLEKAIVKPGFKVNVAPGLIGRNITLIFELWRYDPGIHGWVYTGDWAHIHIRVAEAP